MNISHIPFLCMQETSSLKGKTVDTKSKYELQEEMYCIQHGLTKE
jgi:hypothetical protein